MTTLLKVWDLEAGLPVVRFQFSRFKYASFANRQNQFYEAARAYEAAVTIYSEQAYLPDVATTLNNLGSLYRATQRMKEGSLPGALRIPRARESQPEAYPKILVTGATGKTGRAVVADMFDSDLLLAAMRGTQRAYYLPFYHPYMIQSATAFAVAAREAKLEAVVSLGQCLASPVHPSLATLQAWLADQVFSMMPGVAHVRVNPGSFADNYLRLIEYAAHLGVLPSFTGDSKDAPPSNEDIARVVVAVLIDLDKHAGKEYRPTGPALLSASDMAEILSRVLRRKVGRIDLPWWMFMKAARRGNAGAFLMSGLRYYVEDHKQGACALSAPTNDVLEVTGRPAEDFEITARRYAARPEA
jgi:uncharacterized protein YbjT (DUF2867 family)